MQADTYQRVTYADQITETDTYIFATLRSNVMFVATSTSAATKLSEETFADYPAQIELNGTPKALEFNFSKNGEYYNIYCVTNENYWNTGTNTTISAGKLTTTSNNFNFSIIDKGGEFILQSVTSATASTVRGIFFQNGSAIKNYATSNYGTGGYTGLAIYKKGAADTREEVTLDLSVPTELNVGDTGKATVTASPDVAGITLSSSDEAVATIAADGTITALAAGETTITATYAGDDTHKPASASAAVRVISNEAPEVISLPFGTDYWQNIGSYTLTATSKDGEWTIANFNNNNNVWTNQIKCGNKTSASTGQIITAKPIPYAINKAVLKIDAVTSANVTSTTLYIADNLDFTDATTISFGSITKGDNTVEIPAPAKNMYYKVEIVCTKGSANGLVTVGGFDLYVGEEAEIGDDVTVAPEFSVESGEVEAGTKVALTSKTEGAAIYYTIDGTAPTTESTLYTEPITISETTTIKAIAVKDGLKDSPVAQITYTVVPAYATLAEFIAAAPTTAAILDCPLTVTYYNGKNLYVTDGTTPGFLYSNSLSGSWENGDVIPAGIRGSWDARYNEIVVETESIQEATKGAAVAAQKVENISKDMLHSYVELSNVVISNVSGKNATGTLANAETVAIYNNFGLTLEEGTYASVYGIVNVYNTSSQTGTAGSLQLYPTEMVAVPPTAVAALTISPEFGDIAEGSEITVSCDTEGATLSGTIGETTLTDQALPYTYTITEAIDSKIAVSLKATKEGLTDSELLEGEFTVTARPAFEQVEATFNFADTNTFTASEDLSEPVSGAGTNLSDGVTFTSGKISLAIAQGTATTKTRFWNAKGTTELRVYKNATMTVKTNSNTASLDMVEFTLNSGSLDLPSDQLGTFTNNVWTAPVEPAAVVSRADNSKVSEVTFGVTTNAQIANMKVTSTEVTTGITNVEMIENVPVIYYNIQGQRVINPAKGQLLIRVQGTNVTKVIL